MQRRTARQGQTSGGDVVAARSGIVPCNNDGGTGVAATVGEVEEGGDDATAIIAVSPPSVEDESLALLNAKKIKGVISLISHHPSSSPIPCPLSFLLYPLGPLSKSGWEAVRGELSSSAFPLKMSVKGCRDGSGHPIVLRQLNQQHCPPPCHFGGPPHGLSLLALFKAMARHPHRSPWRGNGRDNGNGGR